MGTTKTKSAIEIRKDLFNTIQDVLNGHTLGITQKKGNSLLLSKDDYAGLPDKIDALECIARGLKDLAEGRFSFHQDTVKILHRYIHKK